MTIHLAEVSDKGQAGNFTIVVCVCVCVYCPMAIAAAVKGVELLHWEYCMLSENSLIIAMICPVSRLRLASLLGLQTKQLTYFPTHATSSS